MAAPVTRRGTYAVGRARRAEILGVAKEQFARVGFIGTSLAQIARAAGVTETGLKHHFASKDEMLMEVLASAERDAAQVATDLLQGTATPEQLWETLIRLGEHNAAMPGLVQLSVVLSAEATLPDHPAHLWMRQRATHLRDLTAAVLRRGVAAGEVRGDLDCEGVARETIAVLDGLQLQWILNDQDFDMAAAVRDYVTRLAASVSSEASGPRLTLPAGLSPAR